ncbi:VOC family protein [Pinirhizobacter soli]|uniref:VOC family protein n=1 Tax=Pinirhizobacter soli TaxID=2786953 RepID=UPI00202A11C0|nr:VOC family protein [Pinirhizobacter soli]
MHSDPSIGNDGIGLGPGKRFRPECCRVTLNWVCELSRWGLDMQISNVIAQLRTTDISASIDFYTTKLGLTLGFRYQDFYAGICAGNQMFHLKLVDEMDPSIPFVDDNEHFHLYLQIDDVSVFAAMLKSKGVNFVKDVHKTPWGTREFVIKDNQGHTLYFGQVEDEGKASKN